METSQSISHHNNKEECGNFPTKYGTAYSHYLLSLASHQFQLWFSHVKNCKLILQRALANKGAASLALIKALALSSTSNVKVYVGLFLIVLSPFGACIHLFYDRKSEVAWLMDYHQNYFHLFNLLGAWIFSLIVFTGLFILLPPVQKTWKVYKYSLKVQLTRLLALPIGFVMSKIVWLIQTTSNEDFWSIPGWSYTIAGLCVGYVFIRSIDYFIWKQFHAFDALLASLEGLHQLDIPGEMLREKAAPLINELKQFHSKY